MINHIKMIAFDLDGTLLNSEKVFTDQTRKIVAEAVRQGIVALPATGRPYTGVPKEVVEFPGIRYAVTANGARIIEVVKDTALYEKLVSVDIARKVLDIFEHYDTLREVYYNGVVFTEEKALCRITDFFAVPAMADYIMSTRIKVDSLRNKFEAECNPVDKVQAVFASAADKEKALKELKKIQGIEVTGALANNIEVGALGVNKGNALLRLGDMLGISREEILAFGDGANDIEMLKNAGFGVAMSNSLDEVKAAADYVTVSNDEEGVSKVIEQYVLRQKGRTVC